MNTKEIKKEIGNNMEKSAFEIADEKRQRKIRESANAYRVPFYLQDSPFLTE